jgi:NitT/TauT family transport system ATP-binding protein
LCDGAPVRGLNKRVTYMTQRDTLLPWRTALDNAALPLEIRGVGKAERHRRAREALALTGLSDAEKRRPHQLSGGMRSRLALARVLLSDANIVLMDEPFAALDALRRVRLQQLLLEIRGGSQQTLLYVTHDLNEAIALGDRIILMGSHPGRILLERHVDIPHPRDVARVRTMPAAEELYAELWSVLESQIQ